MSLKLVGGIVLGCIITIICFQNYNSIELSILFWQLEIPGIFVILTVFIFGFPCGVVYKNIIKI